MKFFVNTLGCQMNAADSEELFRHLLKCGHVEASSEEEADLVILNTCTVRQHAEDKALSKIGRLKFWKKKDPDRILILVGCAAERLKDSIQKRFPHIDLVIGAKNSEEYPRIVDALLKEKTGLSQPIQKQKEKAAHPEKPPQKKFNWLEESEEGFADKNLRPGGEPFLLGDPESCTFLTIMRGCNYTCSYCIVPFVRGREIYRPAHQILNEIRKRAKEGKKDVMLLGQTVNSYWFKEKTRNGKWKIIDFSDLLKEIEKIENIQTIRFMSPHPHYMNDKLFRTISESKKISPNIHLPVQSGSSKVLKLMKRNYTREEFVSIARKLEKALPGVYLSTDFIVGFPGESEKDFQETLSLLDEVKFRSAFCFKYSSRTGTEASRFFDNIPSETKEKRLSMLLEKVFRLKENKAELCSVV